MSVNTDKNNELKTVSIEKNIWILELPEEICQREGLATGTLISLTLKNDSVLGEYVKPTKEINDFIDLVIEEEKEYFEEIKRLGD